MNNVKVIRLSQRLFADERGWAFFPFQDFTGQTPDCDLTSLHVVRTEPGHVRGNHRHPETDEWLHLFGARALVCWEEDGCQGEALLDGDDYLLHIPAGVAHAVKNIGDGPLFLVAFRDKAVAPPHTEPADVI